MPQEGTTTKKLIRAALASAFGAALVIASSLGSAVAADEEEDDLPDTKFFRSILTGLGLKQDGAAGIDYRERSPLVVPPNRDLPPPESEANGPKVADWPVDPDEKRRKEAAAAKKKLSRKTVDEEREEESRPLRPDQLTRGSSAAAARRPAPSQGNAGDEKSVGAPLKPWELGYKGDLFTFNSLFGSKQEIAKFEREPPRQSLTDPPSGYRTPSPAQPYGLNPSTNKSKQETFDRPLQGTK